MLYRRKIVRRAAATGGLLFALSGYAAGSPPSTPEARQPLVVPVVVPANEAQHIDLARYLFPSPDKEQADRALLFVQADSLAALAGSVTASPAKLLEALQMRDQLQVTERRHEMYLHLRCKANRHDGNACDDEGDILDRIATAIDRLNKAIATTPPATLQGFFDADRRLTAYRYAVDKLHRFDGHSSPAAQAETIGLFEPEVRGWQSQLYDDIFVGIDFGKVDTPAGSLDVLRQRTLIASMADRQSRRIAFEKLMDGLASRRELFAFTLIHLVKAENKLAVVNSFPTGADQSYFRRFLDPNGVRALLASVASHGDLAKRFQMIRSEDVRRRFGIIDTASYDLGATTAPVPHFSLSESRATLHRAFADLGSWYQTAFDALLDPANGRSDIVTGGAPNRSGGGFGEGFTGVTSMLFVENYNGTFKDLSTIAHEGGHAVHRQLMTDHGVAPSYAGGPNWLAESFAEFNELVLADYLAEHTSDPQLKRWYEEQFLGVKGLDWIYGARDAMLEQAVYDRTKAGSIHGADDLDALAVEIGGKFSLFTAKEPRQRNWWIATPLMFEDPNYDVNYVYAGLLALKYFAMFKANPGTFLARYRALLEGGFDAPPEQLLKHRLGIDLDGPALVEAASAIVDARLRALEAN